MRHSIDNLDAALMYLLAERFKQTQQVGRLKAAYAMPPLTRPGPAPVVILTAPTAAAILKVASVAD